MKYAISLLRTEKLEYKKERYDTREEAEKAYMAIPEARRLDFGIAEIMTEKEIEEQAQRLEAEQRSLEEAAMLRKPDQVDLVVEDDLTTTDTVVINGKEFISVEKIQEG